MAKAKPKITKTLGPIHFEDLDPHRFEDLVRQLIYDFKEWQTIEATGRSGKDEGFDVRAYERVIAISRSEDEDGKEIEAAHPMDGNLWMIQSKREKALGPAKVKEILADIDPSNPPYGYILAASANFSKESYDLFRFELRNKGVMEFYLWGKGELEDMLHLPKNDRILFTFFGISLVSRKRSRITEVRSIVTVKNKVITTLGDGHNLYQSVLIRDLKDEKYPYKAEYPDFEVYPRWKEYRAHEYHPLGVWLNAHKYYAYIDFGKKEWDFTKEVDLLFPTNESEEEREKTIELQKRIEGVWDFFPKTNQAYLIIDGLVKFEDISLLDQKGDVPYDFPHFYVDFEGSNGPFAAFWEQFKVGEITIKMDASWDRISVFPKKFTKPSLGRVRSKNPLSLDPGTLKSVKDYYDREVALYDLGQKYKFLKVRDIVPLVESGDGNDQIFIQITCHYEMTIKDYFAKYRDNFFVKQSVQRQLGSDKIEGSEEAIINIYEFKRIHTWQFEK